MNQHEQMLREALNKIECESFEFAIRSDGKHTEWFQKIVDLARHALAAQAAPTEPAPLVRLTDDEIAHCEGFAQASYRRHIVSVRGQMAMPQDVYEWHFANALMDAMDKLNGG